MHRIYIFGPSGSGTTTLAKALSSKLGCQHIDTDDHFWQRTPQPYTSSHPVDKRISTIRSAIEDQKNWLISGCMCSWGKPLLDKTTHAIYLYLPWQIRRERLKQREIRRYGKGCLSPGGHRHAHFQKFIDWASLYDTADESMRSRRRHDTWLHNYQLNKPVLRLESDQSVQDRLQRVLHFLDKTSRPALV